MSIRVAPLLSICLQVSFHAGRAIRTVKESGNLQVVQKGVNDPVTIADITAQRIIAATLAHYFPRLTLIGEENVPIDSSMAVTSLIQDAFTSDILGSAPTELNVEDLVVWVDPLDGTQGFVESNCSCVTTLIGIAYRGRPLFGLVHQPFTLPPDTYWGGCGMGVRKTSENGPLYGQPVERPAVSSNLVIATSSSHLGPADISFLQSLSPSRIIRTPGCGYKTLLVVTGEASLYVFLQRGQKKWDTCATEAIFKGLGGVFSDASGGEYAYHKEVEKENRAGVRGIQPILTFDPALHAAVLQKYQIYQSRL